VVGRTEREEERRGDGGERGNDDPQREPKPPQRAIDGCDRLIVRGHDPRLVSGAMRRRPDANAPLRALGAEAPPATVDATSNEAAISATPPVNPELVRAPEVSQARRVGSNVLEILVFRGLSTPLALLLVVLQGRFLEPSGRGRFVLAVLTVSIFSRLLSQLGIAVANHMGRREWDTPPELRPLVQRALGIAAGLGLLGSLAVVGIGELTPSVGIRAAAIAAAGLAPNVLWQTASGILLGLGRIRPWNYVQLASPLATVAGTLVLVVGLGGQVDAALAAWTAAHVVTCALALFLMRDVWLPLGRASLVDGVSQTLVRLALAMGGLQVIALVGYRVELVVLGAVDASERWASTPSRIRRPSRCG
jgi:hypothetical protein